jgi:glucose-6-phosphate isomerase
MHDASDLLARWPALEVPAKRARLRNTLRLFSGPLAKTLDAHAPEAESAVAGLWQRDPSVWSGDAATQQKIAHRLGWLSSPALMADSLGRLQEFAASVKEDGFTDVVLLGMGGSSLAPEVLRAVFGAAPGWPRLHVLDSTDPASVRAAATAPARTLYILSSKSGTTIEPNVLAAYFRRTLEEAGVRPPAGHFVAITDEGTDLARRARTEGFRDVFINPADIGGRYSALSFFGLVPAALMGLDIASLVGWGLAMLSDSESGDEKPATSPSAALGLAIAGAALAGRDKLTLVLPAALEPFGLWVEQLIAESTGKDGTGVVPIAGETLAEPPTYGSDRFFVRVRLHGSYADTMRNADIGDLKAADLPIAEIELAEPAALGAEFVLWEVATAIVGALLHINPFDEPNVQQAKDATRTLLDHDKSHGRLPIPSPDLTTADGVALTLSTAARGELGGQSAEALLTLIRPGDYFALLAYVGPDQELADELRAFRLGVRDRTGPATMFGYGPRYLHSTGQLHKGGPNTGVFVLLTATPGVDLAIPGEVFSFGTLELAQALGDFASLDAAARRAVHVHLPAPDRRLIREVADALLMQLPKPR